MRVLIDTNILLYAANQSDDSHLTATDFLRDVMAGSVPWCLTWPIVYEFLRVSTHPRVFRRPLRHRQAMTFLDALLRSARLTMLLPTPRHHEVLTQTIAEVAAPAGNIFHDIATAVMMREHGVPEIATADRDFLQFRFLKVFNPLQPKR